MKPLGAMLHVFVQHFTEAMLQNITDEWGLEET